MKLIKFAVEQNPETALYLPDEYFTKVTQFNDREFCVKVFSHTIPDKLPLLAEKYSTGRSVKTDLENLKQKALAENFQLCDEMREVLDSVKVNPKDVGKAHHKYALFNNVTARRKNGKQC